MRVERDSQAVDTSLGWRDVAVSEVEPEHIGVLFPRQAREAVALLAPMLAPEGSAVTDQISSPAPVAYGAPRDSGAGRDLAVSYSASYELPDLLKLLIRAHANLCSILGAAPDALKRPLDSEWTRAWRNFG